jgi:hypothetical protein
VGKSVISRQRVAAAKVPGEPRRVNAHIWHCLILVSARLLSGQVLPNQPLAAASLCRYD